MAIRKCSLQTVGPQLFSLIVQAQDPTAAYKVFVSASMEHFFEDDKYSTKIVSWRGSKTTRDSDRLSRNKDLRPGDFVVIGHEAENGGPVYHVALFIDDDLFFEKAGPENRKLARFTTYEHLVKIYEGSLFTARRMKGNPLPAAESFLDGIFSLREVVLEKDQITGRATLPDHAKFLVFTPSDFHSSLPKDLHQFCYRKAHYPQFGSAKDMQCRIEQKRHSVRTGSK